MMSVRERLKLALSSKINYRRIKTAALSESSEQCGKLCGLINELRWLVRMKK